MKTEALKPLPLVPAPPAKVKPPEWPCDFRMLSIGSLFIRDAYQRGLTKRSARTAIAIAKSFAWEKFGCLVVRRIGDEDRYEVIDGQHRGIAAKIVGAEQVPAIVIQSGAADAFLGINSVRTQLTPLALFKAELAAGGDEALTIAKIAKSADVFVRTSQAQGAVPPGQTIAISAIRTVLKSEGRRRLEWTFKAIRAAEANATPLDPSMLTARNIRAVAECIRLIGAEWDGQRDVMVTRVSDALASFSSDDLDAKIAERKATNGGGVWKCLSDILIAEVQRRG